MPRTAEDLLQELMTLDESQRIETKCCTQIDRSVMTIVARLAPNSHQPGREWSPGPGDQAPANEPAAVLRSGA